MNLCGVHLAIIRQAAEAASASEGALHGLPPWLIVAAGALVVAIVLWLFAKLVKWTMLALVFFVLVGGTFVAARMLLGM